MSQQHAGKYEQGSSLRTLSEAVTAATASALSNCNNIEDNSAAPESLKTSPFSETLRRPEGIDTPLTATVVSASTGSNVAETVEGEIDYFSYRIVEFLEALMPSRHVEEMKGGGSEIEMIDSKGSRKNTDGKLGGKGDFDVTVERIGDDGSEVEKTSTDPFKSYVNADRTVDLPSNIIHKKSRPDYDHFQIMQVSPTMPRFITLPSGITTQTAPKCGHVMHPAHKAYRHAYCPVCRVRRHITSLTTCVSNAEKESNLEESITNRKIKPIIRGSRKSNTGGEEKFGWRHRKALLYCTLIELETMREAEQRWKGKFTDLGWWMRHTAAAAFVKYEEAKQNGVPDAFEVGCALYARERAHEDEQALAREWGDAPKISNVLSEERRVLDPPKRKRREVECVSFHPEVSIQSEADVDTLRQSSSMHADLHKSARPLRSVLRTTTRDLPLPEVLNSLRSRHEISYTVTPLITGLVGLGYQ
ncbi:hypothetical protein N0V90_009178 [Kalmusia sp. IMI 367209]|nr:hypothetical protein N0V90_009178 [Kalmusia sp. IMI 367209]